MGIGYVIWMIHPPIDTTGRRKPSNFLLWVVGLHVGLLGIAYQRYENAVNRWHNNYNVLIERLGDDYNSAILQLINDKKYDKLPVEPHLLDISSVYRNFNDNWNEPYFNVQPEVDKLLSLYIPSQPGEYKNLNLKEKPLTFEQSGFFTISNSTIENMNILSSSDFIISEAEIDSLRVSSPNFELDLSNSSIREITISEAFGSFNIEKNIKSGFNANNSYINNSKLSIDTLNGAILYKNIFSATVIDIGSFKNLKSEDNLFYKCVFMSPQAYEAMNHSSNYFYKCLIYDNNTAHRSSRIDVSELEAVMELESFNTIFKNWDIEQIENDSVKISYFKL